MPLSTRYVIGVEDAVVFSTLSRAVRNGTLDVGPVAQEAAGTACEGSPNQASTPRPLSVAAETSLLLCPGGKGTRAEGHRSKWESTSGVTTTPGSV